MKETNWVLRKDRECRWCNQKFPKGSSVALFLGHLKKERKKGRLFIHMKPGETKTFTFDRDTTIIVDLGI